MTITYYCDTDECDGHDYEDDHYYVTKVGGFWQVVRAEDGATVTDMDADGNAVTYHNGEIYHGFVFGPDAHELADSLTKVFA